MSQERPARIQQRVLQVIMEELQGWINDLLRDALDPAKMMHMLRSMGVDFSQLGQMFGQAAQAGTMPQGFDPYKVMGLDKSASDDEVKKRYHELIKKLHPDSAGIEGTSFLLQMVLAAYELIKKERGWQ